MLNKLIKIVILSNIIVSVSVALSANEMPVKQTDASCSKEEDITAIKDWLVTIKTEKIAKRLRRDKWTKIALRVDRIFFALFSGLVVIAIIATFITLIAYEEIRKKPDVTLE